MTENSQNAILTRASKQLISDFYDNNKLSIIKDLNGIYYTKPEYPLKTVIEMISNDSVFLGAVTTLVDKVIEGKYKVVGKDQRSRVKDAEKKLEELRFKKVLREALYHLFTYNNAFIEIVKNKKTGDAKELWVLDPTTMNILVNKHGEVVGYEQQVGVDVVDWDVEDIVHLKNSTILNNVWGNIDVKSIYRAVTIKFFIKEFINWLFETNQYRSIFNIKKATEDQIRRFLDFYKQTQNDRSKPLIIEGEIEKSLIRELDSFSDVRDLLYKMDEEILNLLQVPPIYAGLPDNSNRSNSDAQERAFNTRINSIRSMIEDVVSNELLPRIGFNKVFFKFINNDELSQKRLIEIASTMYTMGFSQEAIKEYLLEQGFPIPDVKTVFTNNNEEVVSDRPKDEKQYPSRKRKVPGEANKKIGTGERGTTREDQLIKRSTPFNTYPYVYEIKE